MSSARHGKKAAVLKKLLRPYTLSANEGWHCDFGVDFVIKASELREGSGAAVLVYETRAGEEPEAHAHPTEDEMFYVLEGAITFFCGGERFDLQKDGFIYLPHGMQHSYLIPNEDPVRLLVVTAPVRDGASGGWGGFVGEMENAETD